MMADGSLSAQELAITRSVARDAARREVLAFANGRTEAFTAAMGRSVTEEARIWNQEMVVYFEMMAAGVTRALASSQREDEA